MAPTVHFLKLRGNLSLAGDVSLAERELARHYQSLEPVEDVAAAARRCGMPESAIVTHSRPGAFPGFLGIGPRGSVETLCRSLACFQEVWVPPSEFQGAEQAPWWQSVSDGAVCALPLLASGEMLGHWPAAGAGPMGVKSLAGMLSSGASGLRRAHLRPSAAPHVHGLHKYKARFFPRLARVLLGSLPANSRVLDPFIGSGTTCVEASWMGLDSVGVDIDPLSCAISQAKLELMGLSPEALEEGIEEMGEPGGGAFHMPEIMARKFHRRRAQDEQVAYEEEIAGWMNAARRVRNPRVQRVLEIVISDAIARKFNVRMMGTGVPRFALEIRRSKLDSLVRAGLERAVEAARIVGSLRDAYGGSLGSAEVRMGNATDLPFADSSFDAILTSPPYLPASSGRENYLTGKCLSMMALGLLDEAGLARAEKASVGSMKASARDHHDPLPDGVYELVDWLAADELRAIKAEPTLAYYQVLRDALRESLRVLRPGGTGIWVIGRESVFYTFKTREVRYRVACDALFQELAEKAGFAVVDRVDVELDKRNRNARPRSRDPYFETALVLEKPGLASGAGPSTGRATS
jgi:tRNA G10  N-methylase Trm11